MFGPQGTDFMALSKQRHTVRKYSQKPVEQEKVKKILEAGRWAPTAVNAQPQRILVLNTPEELQKVKDFCTFGWKKKYVDLAEESDTVDHKHIVIYYGAPLVLMVCYDKKACWKHPESGTESGQTDAVIVATHIMLEAVSLGLGTAWISYFDEQKARKSLHLPDDWQPVCMLYIGYPADDYQPNQKLSIRRKPLTETCFFDKVG
ncbi:nitroreductase family protein [Mitsuokella sp. WILCCON 0060]|uniref:nitroreductase family protein n=1 Tax=Mitsuokella sp. WILCCON 0060 TaxID=3345341 RepID=UPI003F193E4D